MKISRVPFYFQIMFEKRESPSTMRKIFVNILPIASYSRVRIQCP
jgi:hypothetical protein